MTIDNRETANIVIFAMEGNNTMDEKTGPGEAPATEIVAGEKASKPDIPVWLKIVDYVLAGISAVEGIYKFYLKVSGNGGDRSWTFVILPFALAVGLMLHKKSYRIICIALLALSLLLPLILAGILL
jgi:hypothetical protein